MRPKPAVLLILDGFGLREAADDNAIHHAYTPIFDRLAKSAPSARLETSGEAVGLPIGQMGNSEVGHMNLGTGRIVYQDFTRITKAIDSPRNSQSSVPPYHGQGRLAFILCVPPFAP